MFELYLVFAAITIWLFFASLISNHKLAREASRVNRVLVVEDNHLNQLLAYRTLESIGIQAHVVGNGHEALAALEEGAFDLILMDIHMPVLDGYETCKAIRASAKSFHRIPIVALTANIEKIDRERCFEAGMNDFLPKPIDQKVLGYVLDRWLPDAA